LEADLIVVENGIIVAEEVRAEFFCPHTKFGDVLATLRYYCTTTSRVMDKLMLPLDSAGQKGSEITLKGVLIVVES